MRCQACGCYAETKYVEFYQNIGAFVMRFSQHVKGNLCKRCINHYFWKFTLTTLAVGWLGMISLILAPIFIINNVVRFLTTMGMTTEVTGQATKRPPVSPHPTLSLNDEATSKLEPFFDEIQSRYNKGEALDSISQNIGPRAGVSAIQVELFIAQCPELN